MIEYAVEQISDVLEELKPLLERHWEEIAINKDKIKLAPDYDRYKKMEELGLTLLVTARHDGNLVGYCVNFMTPNLHYSNNIFAVNDVIFILPEYRKGRAGMGIIKFAEKEMQKCGVDVASYRTKVDHDFGKVLEYLGYDWTEKGFYKYIGGQG